MERVERLDWAVSVRLHRSPPTDRPELASYTQTDTMRLLPLCRTDTSTRVRLSVQVLAPRNTPLPPAASACVLTLSVHMFSVSSCESGIRREATRLLWSSEKRRRRRRAEEEEVSHAPL